MENIISFFKEVFLGRETKGTIVGLADFKEKKDLLKPAGKKVNKEIKQLKLSELMRKTSF